MPQQTKIFRVFVSSTFTDMKLERGILQRDAFPRLEKFCEEKGAKFQAVDLRWGVNEESSLNQKTLQICFNEIARCQKVSPRPNFLILLGDKYGWQPVPEIIPAEEMKEIKKHLSEDETVLIDKWYLEDLNAVPAEFVLKPREASFMEYGDWEPVERAIRTALRNGVSRSGFEQVQKLRYFASATHQEIMRGALSPPEGAENPEKHVFTFSRNIAGLPNDQSASGFIDLLKDNTPDKESMDKLKELKSVLEQKLGVDSLTSHTDGHYINYTAGWKDGALFFEPESLKTFNDRVYEVLEKVIREQLSLDSDHDEIVLESKLHQETKTRLTEHFMGRDEILKEIQDYIENKDEKKVLAMIGTSGSGKSSVMAQAVKLNEPGNALIVCRFIGSTSRSSNILTLLQSVCGEIANAFGVNAISMTHEGGDKEWYDLFGLSEILKKCLALAKEEKPIILFLDSLDQLSDTDNARALYWLPRDLPDHARMVVSSLPELESNLHQCKRIELPVLPEGDARKILDLWLKSAGRTLTSQQYETVLSGFSETRLPVYLKLAFEKARHWHSYDKAHQVKRDVPGIINEYFDDLEKEFPEDFVRNAISYLLSGRYLGLSENEILEILAFDDEYWKKFLETTHRDHREELMELKAGLEQQDPRGYMKIPISVWSRLYLDLEPFLTERDADGVPIITFFHRQFNEVLRARFELS